MHKWLGSRLALLALLSGTACGEPSDKLPREPVRGTVTFDGKPLESGTVVFLPASVQGQTQSGGMIQHGVYDIPRREGPVPGVYTVVITAAAGNAAAPAGAPGKELPIPKQPIPARYNTKSDLKVEVKQGGDNQFNFDLKK
jgi:hypothetical protein